MSRGSSSSMGRVRAPSKWDVGNVDWDGHLEGREDGFEGARVVKRGREVDC